MSQLDNWINSELEAEFREVQKIKPLEILVHDLLEKVTAGKEEFEKKSILQSIYNKAIQSNLDVNQIDFIERILNK